MALANDIGRRTFLEVYNLCFLHFHRLTVHVHTRIVFLMKLLLCSLSLLLLDSSLLNTAVNTSVGLLVYSYVFKTYVEFVSKR